MLLFILVATTLTNLQVNAEANTTEDMPITQMVFFHVNGCEECIGVKEYMTTMDQTYEVTYNGVTFESRIQVLSYDIGDAQSLELMYRFYEAYEVPKDRQFVPSIYIGDVHLLGVDEVRKSLVKNIRQGHGLVEESLTEDILSAEPVEISLSGQSVAGVLTTGLLNGFNPCSISMILFLLSLLVTKKNNVLKLGLAFIGGKFIAYLLLGTAFYSLLSSFDFTLVNTIVKVVLVVIFGGLSIMNLLDFFAAKGEQYGKIKTQLPAGLRRFNHNMIKKFTDVKNQRMLVLVCFLLGGLISAGEFLCTGQIYLATILYVLQNSAGLNMVSLMYFVLYCLAFITPLVVITVIIHKTKSFFDISEAIREKMHLIKLVNAIFFAIFVIVVLLLY